MRLLITVSCLLLLVTGVQAAGTFEEGLAAYDEASASRDSSHPGYAKAYEIWKPLVAEGHPGARYHVAMLQYFGLGGVEWAPLNAVETIVDVAEGGYYTAQSFIGLLSERGDGTYVRRGEDVALVWYGRAAEAGHCVAVRRMATAYDKGQLGLAPDADKAAAWRAREPGCKRR